MSMPLMRFVIGCACEAEPDKQGRIAISQYLRSFADIKTDVTIISMGNVAEIWDTALLAENDEVFDQASIRKLARKAGV